MKTKPTLAALLLAAVMVTPSYGADEGLTDGAKDALGFFLVFGSIAVTGYIVYRINLKEWGPQPPLETASDVWDGICVAGGWVSIIAVAVVMLFRWVGS